MLTLPDGIKHFPGYLDCAAQEALLADIRAVVSEAPLFTPQMPRTGKEMSVKMTNCGGLGWVTDKDRGYRYQAAHPVTGIPWPQMPARLRALWDELAHYPHKAEACLVNFYSSSAKMGLHQDRDEKDFDAPVLSVSLGDACMFRVGGVKRDDKTVSFRLESGDVVLIGGTSRLAFHGVDRIFPDSSPLLKNGGRINLTMRRVTNPRD
jgi:DNA oxidative demethylase